jgi:hypothetical protein
MYSNRLKVPHDRAALKAATIALSAASFGLGVQPADASDWQLNPHITVSGNYDDNYRLSDVPGEEVRVSGGAIEAAAQLRYQAPRTSFDITPRLRSSFYPGHAQEQANDQFVDFGVEHRWQTAKFTLNGDVWRQYILRDFLPTTDIGSGLGKPGGGTDIGAITIRDRQDFALLAPAASFEISPRRRLELDAQFMDAKYSQQIAGLREDFKNVSGGLGFAADVSQTSTVTVRGIASQFKPETGSTAHTDSLQGEWSVRQSEVRQAYARIGADHTQFSQAQGGSSSATSVSAGAGVSQKFQLTDLFVDLTRSVSPNSSGTVVARDEFRLRLQHRYGPRSAGFLGLRGIKDSALGSGAAFNGDRYATASCGFEWRLLRQLSIVPAYSYTSRKSDISTSSATSNSVTISINYEPHRLASDIAHLP